MRKEPTVSAIRARKILNSRDDWTVEAEVELSDGTVSAASVPEGKSRGTFEAVSLPAETAVKNVLEIIAPALTGFSPSDQAAVDAKLIACDGTKNKARLGGNATLAVSIAVARAAARSRKIPLWRHLSELGGAPTWVGAPRLLVNVINGGLHAGNGLPFQEYLVIPKAEKLSEAVALSHELYKLLGERLTKCFGSNADLLGDEGGFAPRFKNPAEPFEIIRDTLQAARLEGKFDLGLDVAASNVTLSEPALASFYEKLKAEFRLAYLEDPFTEDEFEKFAKLRKKFGSSPVIVGDDLTVTNVERMRTAKEADALTGIIIKPNQIGTVTETISAVTLAREYGWQVFVSHRSGETNDDFIADLAVGLCADGIKLGSPARGERLAKYNRLLEIEVEGK